MTCSQKERKRKTTLRLYNIEGAIQRIMILIIVTGDRLRKNLYRRFLQSLNFSIYDDESGMQG